MDPQCYQQNLFIGDLSSISTYIILRTANVLHAFVLKNIYFICFMFGAFQFLNVFNIYVKRGFWGKNPRNSRRTAYNRKIDVI